MVTPRVLSVYSSDEYKALACCDRTHAEAIALSHPSPVVADLCTGLLVATRRVGMARRASIVGYDLTIKPVFRELRPNKLDCSFKLGFVSKKSFNLEVYTPFLKEQYSSARVPGYQH